jgi:hypothetical protein
MLREIWLEPITFFYGMTVTLLVANCVAIYALI